MTTTLKSLRVRYSPLAIAMMVGGLAVTSAEVLATQAELSVSSETINTPVLRGQLSNGKDAFLQGAIVRLLGTNRETVTDRTGRFRFDNVPEGEYQLEVSYLGYGRHRVNVVISDQQGQALQLRFADAGPVEVMQVIGSRNAQARALNIQRASDNIKSVVSADYLGRFPDANVAESSQRLPGVSIQRDQGEGRYINVRGAPLDFSSVSMNGVALPSPDGGTRAIDLDTIPSDVIASMELTKAITPDMDADAIAGNINIITQGALDSKGAFVRANIAGGKNQKGSGDVYRTGITVGSRIAGNENLGFLFSANHNETDRVTDNVEHAWFEENGQFLPESTEFKDYELTRSRTGLSGRFDWRPSENSHVFLVHNYSRFKDNEYRDTLGVDEYVYEDIPDFPAGVVTEAELFKELRHSTSVKTINTTHLGGNYRFEHFTLDYSASFSKASQKYPNRNYLRYVVETDLYYDFSNYDLPAFGLSAGNLNNDLSSLEYEFGRYERRFQNSEDEEQAYALDFTVPGDWGSASSTLKFGVKARLKDKSNDEDRYRNSRTSALDDYNAVLRDKMSRPFDGRYQFGNKLRWDFVSVYGAQVEAEDDYKIRLADSVTGDYRASEDTISAYVMDTLEWDKTTILFGVRAERTKVSAEANFFNDDDETSSVMHDSRSYTRLFPSAHLRYEFDNSVILRAAYSTGLSRPNFTHMVPYEIAEDDGETVEKGNINLKPTYAHNLDLMAEYYIEPLGLISAGVFYKKLQDPIFDSRTETTIDGVDVDIRMPENGDSGRLYGMELNWQQTLDFLPGLGFSANYTFTDSSADLPNGAGKTDLPGTSRHTYNLAVNYELNKISAQLAYNYRSEYIDAVDTEEPGLNLYWDERGTLDFSAGYQLTRQFSIYFEATNLTDSKGIRYQGERSRVYEHEQFGRSWLIGVRGSF